MNPCEDSLGDLVPELGAAERASLLEVAARLQRDRPLPRAAFRGDLGRRLVMTAPLPTRPPRLRLLIACYAGSGLFLLAIAAAGVAGTGPFAA